MEKISYVAIENRLDVNDVECITSLCNNIFGNANAEMFNYNMTFSKHQYLLLAFDGAVPVGFKLGYSIGENIFYSWLGGVESRYRRQGIANELMKMQHDWCKLNSFKIIQTKTSNEWTEMLILNLRHKFSITGTYINQKKELKILLEKKL